MNYLVFDIGGTAVKYALMTESSKIIEKGEVSTPKVSFEDFIEKLLEIYYKYNNIKGIAISLPGKIDSISGFSYSGGSLAYNSDKNIPKFLSSKLGIPVTAENDGKCAALAEAWKGNLSDCNDGIVVILGTGVGGGIIKNKQVHRGKEFIAGEFSFMINNTNAKKGEKLSLFGSNGGVPYGLCSPVASIKGLSREKVDGKKVFQWANEGDSEVLEILDNYCYNLALNLHNLQHIYNPEKIAIGGGISSQNILFEYLEKNIDYLQNNFAYGIPPLSKPHIVKCQFRNDANLIGALYHYMTLNSLEFTEK